MPLHDFTLHPSQATCEVFGKWLCQTSSLNALLPPPSCLRIVPHALPWSSAASPMKRNITSQNAYTIMQNYGMGYPYVGHFEHTVGVNGHSRRVQNRHPIKFSPVRALDNVEILGFALSYRVNGFVLYSCTLVTPITLVVGQRLVIAPGALSHEM